MARTITDANGEAFTLWFVMGEYGWADLFFESGGMRYPIALSDFSAETHDPFKALARWMDAIAGNRLPASIEIDEEGSAVRLEVQAMAGNVCLRMLSRNGNTGGFDPVFARSFDRQTLADVLQSEFIRFFSEDFDPAHWDKPEYDKADERFHSPGLKEWVLARNWQNKRRKPCVTGWGFPRIVRRIW